MVNTPDAPSGNQTSFISAAGEPVNVPDAKLMFTGDYSRSGENLVLTGDDGGSLVIGGYFASETPATLISPSGSILTGDVVQSLAGPMFPGQYAQAGTPDGGQPIGTVVSLTGTASAKRASGVDVELKSGDPVFQGDVVQTGADSAVGLSFADKSVFNMSASARMVLNEFVYEADSSSNKMLFNFVEGTFSFVSGQVAPTGDMKLQTPVAVMAIRGTAPVADINLDQGTINFYLGVLPGKAPGSYNLEDFDGNVLVVVNDPSKGITLTSAGGTPQVFEVTGENLIFLENLTQQLINTIKQSGLEELLKKTGSLFELFGSDDPFGIGGSGLEGTEPLFTVPLPEPITFPGGQTDAFLVISANVVPTAVPTAVPDVVEAPTLVVSGDVDPNGTSTIKEDGSANIVVDVAAAAGSNDVISQIVISGLDPDASYVINDQAVEARSTTFTLAPPPGGDFGATETVTIVVTPEVDSDVDLPNLIVTAITQDGDAPNVTNQASVSVPIIVDAVLDETLELTVSPPNFYELLFGGGEIGSAPDGVELDSIPLGLTATLNNAGFLDSLEGGEDTDNSEQVAMTVAISAGAILMFTDVQALGIQVDTSEPGEWTFTGTTQSDWNTLVDSFAVTPADGFIDGEITATFSIQTQEANTPQGEVAASGAEPNVADNTANFDLTLTLDIQSQGGEELVGLNGEGEQIRLAFFSDRNANPDNFDYDQGGTIVNGSDRDAEWEDTLQAEEPDFNDVQFNVEVLQLGEGEGGDIELTPTTNYGVIEGDLVYELPSDSQLTISIDNLFSNAGFDNTVGVYVADENGNPIEGYILVTDASAPATLSAEITIDTSELDPSAVTLGFFIIPDGDGQNDLEAGQHVEFVDGDLGGYVAVDTSDFTVTASTDEGVVWEFDSSTYEYVNDLSTSSELPVISGTDAENNLTGSQDDEILVGFGGQDTLTGNGGDNLFVLTDLAIHDLITDFGQNDAIDVGSFSFSLAVGQITEAALEEYVRYISPNDNDSDQAELGGSAGDLFINVDGTGDPADFTLVAQLQNTPDSVTIQVDDSGGATNEVVIA